LADATRYWSISICAPTVFCTAASFGRADCCHVASSAAAFSASAGFRASTSATAEKYRASFCWNAVGSGTMSAGFLSSPTTFLSTIAWNCRLAPA
jgi:hypothetical protein